MCKETRTKLEKCPFCSRESGHYITHQNAKTRQWASQVICSHCRARGPEERGFPDEESAEYCAMDRWNRMP